VTRRETWIVLGLGLLYSLGTAGLIIGLRYLLH
jgi:hypothetical protein